MSGLNPGGDGLPDYGRAISRTAATRMVLEAPGPLVVISAPAGYGKSVLALTVARNHHYTHASWVDCSELDASSGQLWRAIARAVSPELIPDDPAGASPLIAACDVQESEASLRRAFQHLPSSPVCVVLDNMTLEPDATGYSLADAAAELAKRTHGSSRIVVTSRCDSAHTISALGASAVVSADILRFSDAETRALVDGVAGDEWDHALVGPLRELTGGQAALLSILARHVASGTLVGLMEGTLSLDVKSQLVQLSAQLSAESLEMLYVASMLGHGTAAEVRHLLPEASSRALQSIADTIPLFRVGGGTSPGTFAVHDLAVAVFTDSDFASRNVRGYQSLRESALRELDYLGRYELLFSRLLQEEDDELLAEWVEKRGRRLLERGNLKLLKTVLDGVGAKGGLRRPRVLLLHAGLLRELAEFSEALRKAVVAKDLAFTEAELDVRQDALLMIARLRIDLGFLGEAAVSLEAFLESNQADLANPDSLALAHAYLSACYAYTGRTAAAVVESERARSILKRVESEDTAARVFLCLEGAVGVMGGRWDCALALCGRLLDEEMVSMGLRMQVMMNYGTALSETGRLEHARSTLEEVLAHCRSVGLHAMEYTCLGSMASTCAGTGDYELAEENAVFAVRLSREQGDRLELVQTMICWSHWSLSLDACRSLTLAERALETASMIDCDWLRWTAILAMASAVLAQGDVPAALKQTENARAQAAEANSERGLLCADLILAEIDRRKGRCAAAIARLIPHDEYVRSESANWQIAMYTRAFPHMLGLLAAALSPEALPTRMLRMVLPQDQQKTLRASAEVLDESTWVRLAERVVGSEALADFPYAGGAPVCRVRLFGGLDVSVGDREVGERQWRKRKARALFAMLVLLQGREIARDQVLEHLWPEMDEERGRNNFYVVWSAMKAALVPEADKVTPCPYVENAGGTCRLVSSLVSSDVEQFERELHLAHEAESNGDTAEALRAYRQISLVYRGELLSGDLYNDWFAAPRDRYRRDFGDAMLRAGEILAAGGDHVGALRMVRAGIAADSWREDMLQAVLRYSRESGQRSAAIEIFSTVRTRLSEDLGIDPSAETLRLYEQVLAMEERAPYEADTRDEDWGVPEL